MANCFLPRASCESAPTRTRTLNLLIKSQIDESTNSKSDKELQGSDLGRAALGAASSAENSPIDPDLQAIIQHWPDLPEAVKVGIVAMVKAACG